MRLMTIAMVSTGALALLAGGCSKKVDLTIVNHSDVARTIQVTVPDETMTLGRVGADGGRLTGKVAVKTDDLPAQLRISAGAGAATSFMVTEDTPAKWWFHITRSGAIAGPYGKEDVHVETVEDAEMEMKSEPRMIVK